MLFKATPLLFTGLAVDLALRAGLFNIGAEGQLAVASLVAGAIGAKLPAGTPAIAALPITLACAMAAGAGWATVPAILKGRFGAHEVISTIMMNRIADGLIGFAIASGLALTGTVRTPDVVPGAKMPRLEAAFVAFKGSAASFAIIVAVPGFGGVAVALLGRGNTVGIILSALLFGTLQQGGLALNAHVPKELMDVLQGVVIVAVALADASALRSLGERGSSSRWARSM